MIDNEYLYVLYMPETYDGYDNVRVCLNYNEVIMLLQINGYRYKDLEFTNNKVTEVEFDDKDSDFCAYVVQVEIDSYTYEKLFDVLSLKYR